ncbi:hypothetical protein [Streptomyces ureilyticus]|uniref:Secreted protein n=1 Tax=Streptomyces ureilyticus TaxID=1775131 RepID=A0ABX0DGI8_9ACTN|nr:hypothetical protein [Streptomyces ureilyticus]NGO40635.1 hypothetical protein [Streptomyces ureilyticus]
MATSVAVAEAQTSRAAAAGGWKCAGTKVSRCIEGRGANKLRVNFVNKTNRKVTAEFGVTCASNSGQRVYSLKRNLKARGGYLSQTITCPGGFQDWVHGWQMSSGKVYRTPFINI